MLQPPAAAYGEGPAPRTAEPCSRAPCPTTPCRLCPRQGWNQEASAPQLYGPGVTWVPPVGGAAEPGAAVVLAQVPKTGLVGW